MSEVKIQAMMISTTTYEGLIITGIAPIVINNWTKYMK